MQLIPILILVLAAVASIVIGVEAIRKPLLWKMGLRNARRRPKQTSTVIFGLMIGTAIISAALVAGHSANFGIKDAVYTALAETDETLRLDGLNYFDGDSVNTYLSDPNSAWFDGIAPNSIWTTSVTNSDGELFEPQAYWVGFDPILEKPFGSFNTPSGTHDGTGLKDNEVIISKDLADKLDVKKGDQITLRYTEPVDPLIPEVLVQTGVIPFTAGSALLDVLEGAGIPVAPVTQQVSQTKFFEVEKGATRLNIGLGWNSAPAANVSTIDLDLKVISPSGKVYTEEELNLAISEVPLTIEVTNPNGLEVGTWRVQVNGNIAANTNYVVISLVFYPIYDLSELQGKISKLEEDFGDYGFEDFAPEDFFSEPLEAKLIVKEIATGDRANQFDFENVIHQNLVAQQKLLGRENQINIIKFSNPGNRIAGVALTDQAIERINNTLVQLKETNTQPAIQYLEPRPVKAEFVEIADEAGASTTGLILFAGSLSVITGLFLIINIFTMLAEERRSELGMSRAVGLSRRDLSRLFIFEGSLYAVFAAAMGSLLGLGLAYIMIQILNTILGNLGGVPPLPFKPTISAFLTAMAAGALLTFLTIAVSSRNISRLNIVRSIRGIPEPEKSGTKLQSIIGYVLLVAGIIYVTFGWLPIEKHFDLTPKVFGPLLIAIGFGMALTRVVEKRKLYPFASLLLILGILPSYFLIGEYENLDEANIVGPIRAVLLTLSVVIILAYYEQGPKLAAKFFKLIPRLRPLATPAMSYPQHKRFRTGMTLAMISIVILSIGIFSIFGALLDTPTDRQTGGYDVEARTTLNIQNLDDYDAGELDQSLIEFRVDLLEYYSPDPNLITVENEPTGQFGSPPHHHVYGYDESFFNNQQLKLIFRSEEYATDAEAYQAVLDDPTLAIASYLYSTNEEGQDLSFKVGDKLQVHLGNEPTEFTIVGFMETYHFDGVYIGKEHLKATFPPSLVGKYLYEIADDANSEEVAKLIERNYRGAGLNAESSTVLVEKTNQAFNQLLMAMKLFLSIGLIIGMLSLAIITSRSVLERRQEIGMLRALGYTPKMIKTIFFMEVSATIVLGSIVGTACAVLVTLGIWFSILRDLNLPYVIPYAELAILIVISYAVALMFTAAPIRRVGKVAPAEALRYTE